MKEGWGREVVRCVASLLCAVVCDAVRWKTSRRVVEDLRLCYWESKSSKISGLHVRGSSG